MDTLMREPTMIWGLLQNLPSPVMFLIVENGPSNLVPDGGSKRVSE